MIGNEAEGYLLWQVRVADAEQRAREFVRVMDWLTTSQRAEIEQRYVSDSLQRARNDLERTRARCLALRDEYEDRYRGLRRRCVGLTLAVCAVLGMTVPALRLLLST
ncbi:cytochrome C oxidase subunit I [Streptomyces chiangmaiensis]|uniref:Cytochrome C oxidase subunit I n=1 Tax=Streptomyces chiangmaiensis TaxID=766497 RepID=A0ABU7FYX2_9ACTN|nr:cytochrome C oxidase subunit I [Streptomyces chiangmaiensis]MED7829141.1 cytochrome C oxidase subunit I [Streptomyces chiangmaiensis]